MAEVITTDLHLRSARLFLDSVSNGSYYVWYGNSIDSTANTDVFDAVYYTSVQPYRDMVAGKVIGAADANLMIRSVEYAANTVYAMYDDVDPGLLEKDFYVSVYSGSFHHVFKCLDNDGGSPSTIVPDISDVSADDRLYQTSDGYRWKYMYSVDDAAYEKFYFTGYMPLVPNTSVTGSAATGSIDVIRIDSGGRGYGNYLTGTFSPSDVRVSGDPLVYSVAGNTTASSANGFYTGGIFYISSGAGAGQWRQVTDYYANNSGRYVKIDSAFSTPPTGTSSWEVSPGVLIVGTGTETVRAYGRALVDPAANSVSRIEVLDGGAGYSYATAAVVANSSVSVAEPASIRVINPPPGGHGADAAAELGAIRVAVAVPFSGDELGTIPPEGRFGQYGIMTSPEFANVAITLSSSNGVFTSGDSIVSYTRRRMDSDAVVSANSVTVTSNSGAFDEQFSTGDLVYLIAESGVNRLLTTVDLVHNSSAMDLADAPAWACSSAIVYSAEIVQTGVVADISGDVVYCSGFTGGLSVGDEVMTPPQGASGTIGSISRGGMEKGFNTFVGTHKFKGTFVSGSFQDGEFVYQGNSPETATSSGIVYSVATANGQSTVYVTRANGAFTDSRLKGQNSGVILNVADKYIPEVVAGSGRVLYVRNRDEVARVSNQGITLNYLLTF